MASRIDSVVIRALQIVHLCVLLAVIALLGAIGWRAWKLADEADALASHADANLSELALTLDQVGRPCGSKINGLMLPCGTLAEASKTMLAARSTLVHIDIAAEHEDRNLTTLDAQERQLFADAHGTLNSLSGTATAATQTLRGASLDLSTINDSIAATKPLITASTAMVKHYDAAAPAFTETADNVKRMTADGARITKDAADEADKLAHPPKKKLTFWGAMAGAGMWAHKWLMPSIF